MKKILVSWLAALGYQLVNKRKSATAHGTMESALQSLARKLQIKTIIDVGASSGIWTRLAMKYFPAPEYLLVEANSAYSRQLAAFAQAHANVQFVVAAAGESHGGRVEFSFDRADPYGGQASNWPHANSMSVPEITIAGEAASRDLEGPYLIKLDTHGFEVPILRGASGILPDIHAIIVECYNFRISPEALLFHEMCAYLDQLGFRCIDIADPLWRPYDEAFWQIDMVFVRKDSPEFMHVGYT